MGSLWIVVDCCGVVVDRCGSLWIVVGHSGSLWVVPGFSNYAPPIVFIMGDLKLFYDSFYTLTNQRLFLLMRCR